jgi:hypothetical protein
MVSHFLECNLEVTQCTDSPSANIVPLTLQSDLSPSLQISHLSFTPKWGIGNPKDGTHLQIKQIISVVSCQNSLTSIVNLALRSYCTMFPLSIFQTGNFSANLPQNETSQINVLMPSVYPTITYLILSENRSAKWLRKGREVRRSGKLLRQ